MKRLTLIDKAFLLKKTLLFETLDLHLLMTIADKLNIAAFAPEEVIFTVNEEAHRMYFIVKGVVEIRDSQSAKLATLFEEDFFGDESMFSEKPRAYEAISKASSLFLTLSRTNLLTIISECPIVAIELLQVYTTITPFRPRHNEGL